MFTFFVLCLYDNIYAEDLVVLVCKHNNNNVITRIDSTHNIELNTDDIIKFPLSKISKIASSNASEHSNLSNSYLDVIPSENKAESCTLDSNKRKIQFSIELGYAETFYDNIKKDHEIFRPLYLQYKHGYPIGAGIDYYFSNYFGVGIKYSSCYVSTSVATINCRLNTWNPSFQSIAVDFSDEILIQYIAPLLLIEIPAKHSSLDFKLSSGLILMKDVVRINDYIVTFSRKTLGGEISCGYNYTFLKKFSIGLNFSFLLAKPIILPDQQYYETFNQRNIKRGEISIGLKYKFTPLKRNCQKIEF